MGIAALCRLPATIAISALALAAPLCASANDRAPHASLGQATGEWWQWAFSIPNAPSDPDLGAGSIHPLVGGDGGDGAYEFCGNGQHGDLWLLGGDFSGSGERFERTCTIPYGKTVLLAVINAECSTAEGDADAMDPAGKQAAKLKACAQGYGDTLTGEAKFGPAHGPLKKIAVQRLATSRAFSVYFPPGNIIGLAQPAANPSLSQADGQWVVLYPSALRPGRYRIEFTGAAGDFEIRGAYNLVIAEPNGEIPD